MDRFIYTVKIWSFMICFFALGVGFGVNATISPWGQEWQNTFIPKTSEEQMHADFVRAMQYTATELERLPTK